MKRVKSALPANISLVDELADLLGVSNDSSYRRLRGETPLSIDEIASICSHFKIPFETDSQPGSESVTFSYFPLEGKRENFVKWLKTLLHDVNHIGSVKDHQIIYAADDVPIWHHFINEEFTCFKIFYWMKCILNDPEYADKAFDPELVDKALVDAAKQLLLSYNKTNSSEIWTEDTVNSTLKQIEYFWESGYFLDKEQALRICSDVDEILNVLQKKAEKNSKLINKGEEPVENFKLYRSEVMIGNNSILVNRGANKTAYVSNNTFNFLTTTNPAFVYENEEWLKNLMRKSILISGVSEKQRNQFFKQLRDKVELLKGSIK
ncbi:MAG: hypothetical protein ACHQK8_05740 [Bacteroidia bacterium]